MEKHKFKPFDQVLVRDEDDEKWYPAHYKHYDTNDAEYQYICDNLRWKQCIPYNEETKHLLGTTKSYEKPEPKVWQVQSVSYNNIMTAEELSNFIKGAVINNKDIIDFRIKYIGNN